MILDVLNTFRGILLGFSVFFITQMPDPSIFWFLTAGVVSAHILGSK